MWLRRAVTASIVLRNVLYTLDGMASTLRGVGPTPSSLQRRETSARHASKDHRFLRVPLAVPLAIICTGLPGLRDAPSDLAFQHSLMLNQSEDEGCNCEY
jgi:hypothetical protein